jgi:hypothetical protein
MVNAAFPKTGGTAEKFRAAIASAVASGQGRADARQDWRPFCPKERY